MADDELGAFYTKDLVNNGVATNLAHTQPAHGQTGSCMVLVTPDAERSMCTFLGATAELSSSALHPNDIAKSKIYYMEGYLAASPTGLQQHSSSRPGQPRRSRRGQPARQSIADNAIESDQG